MIPSIDHLWLEALLTVQEGALLLANAFLVVYPTPWASQGVHGLPLRASYLGSELKLGLIGNLTKGQNSREGTTRAFRVQVYTLVSPLLPYSTLSSGVQGPDLS